MIQKQIDRVWGKIRKQFKVVFKNERRFKGNFLRGFAKEIQLVVPHISQEDILIITTGFMAELRTLDPLIREKIIAEGK